MLDDAAFGAATDVVPKFISPADPAARWTGAHGGQAFFAYSTNYLIDADNAIIVDVEATTAIRQAEVLAAKRMIERSMERFDLYPARLLGVHLHLTAQRPLRADCEHVADNEHPDHQHRINRGSTNLGVIARELGIHPRQIENRGDRAHQVIVRHYLLEAKSIEKLLLIPAEPPHHRPSPSLIYLLAGKSRFADNINGLLQQNRP